MQLTTNLSSVNNHAVTQFTMSKPILWSTPYILLNCLRHRHYLHTKEKLIYMCTILLLELSVIVRLGMSHVWSLSQSNIRS